MSPYQRNLFSVIIPIYGKKPQLKKNMSKIFASLKSSESYYIHDWEVIAVIDGENKDSYRELNSIKDKRFSVYQYEHNQGKGYALLYGFKKSLGNYITFIDSDGDIPFQQIFNFFPYLATADIVIGSKRHPFSKVNYPFTRMIMSKGFQILSYIILGSKLRDTQSGLKVIKREALDVLSHLIKINRFAFDVELCFLASKHGFRVVEAPIYINYQGSSTIQVKTVFNMFFDLLRIRFWYSFKQIYQKRFIKNKFE